MGSTKQFMIPIGNNNHVVSQQNDLPKLQLVSPVEQVVQQEKEELLKETAMEISPFLLRNVRDTTRLNFVCREKRKQLEIKNHLVRRNDTRRNSRKLGNIKSLNNLYLNCQEKLNQTKSENAYLKRKDLEVLTIYLHNGS